MREECILYAFSLTTYLISTAILFRHTKNLHIDTHDELVLKALYNTSFRRPAVAQQVRSLQTLH